MKNSTIVIILLLVMNCVTLKFALDNRNLIATLIDTNVKIGQAFEDGMSRSKETDE